MVMARQQNGDFFVVNPYPSCLCMCPCSWLKCQGQGQREAQRSRNKPVASLCRGAVAWVAALEGLREGAASSPESHTMVRDGYLKQAILSRVKNSMGSGEGRAHPLRGPWQLLFNLRFYIISFPRASGIWGHQKPAWSPGGLWTWKACEPACLLVTSIHPSSFPERPQEGSGTQWGPATSEPHLAVSCCSSKLGWHDSEYP